MSNLAYVEHVAIWVKDIQWHIKFFHEALGMGMRELQGAPDDPRQYWTMGGLQFIADRDFQNADGRLAHLGVMCEDLDAAIQAAKSCGAKPLPQGDNWLRLPDGLTLELIQAKPGAVARILAINPRH
jgi:catechol 2,3-dioxygenase-like lactoylglutathione lyase family enzyme